MTSLTRKKIRKERHLRNKEKDTSHKREAWSSGRLIKENHNNKIYSPEYTKRLSNRLVNYLKQAKEGSKSPFEFMSKFYRYKDSAINLLIMWNKDVDKDYNYRYLKGILETYWDLRTGKCDINSMYNYDK